MTLLDYSLDDLHLMATAELDDTPAAEILNDLYRTMTEEYVLWLKALRERQERVQ